LRKGGGGPIPREMPGVPRTRVALGVLLYPLPYVGVLAVASARLPAEQEGGAEIAGVAIGLFVIGFALASWWCLLSPVLWAIVALGFGLAVPLENTDPREGQLLVVLVLILGLLPLGLGIAASRFRSRLASAR
jgi:hypothetical protein